ncbi:MAG: hypothetical protein H7Y37_10145 [Anaerolineae bacterium]|nr:hypothetical protein [Gloeobacterales cyanobacterium ES-bin-313]
MKKEKEVWDTPAPEKKSEPLSEAEKSSAKENAKKAGRPYPNLIDNMNVAKKKRKAKRIGANLLLKSEPIF